MAYVQFEDDIKDQYGAPVVGAKIYVYDQDGALAALQNADTSSKPNPLTSDEYGGFGAYADVGLYTLSFYYAGRKILEDRAYQVGEGLPLPDSVIVALGQPGGANYVGSDDDSSGSLWTTIAGFITYLRSSVGSSIMGFLQSGTGAVARTVQDKGRDWLSPKDFGCVGDGTTNDNANFAKAITQAAASGKVLDLGGQTYLLNASGGTSPINFGVAGLVMRNGHLKFTGAGSALVIDSGGEGDGVAGLRLESLLIEGGASVTDGFYSAGCVRSSFRDIEVRNVTGKAFHIKHGVSNQYDSLKYTTNDGITDPPTPTHGLYVDENGTGHYTADCTFINPVMEGFEGIGCELVKASGCLFLGGTFEGITGTSGEGKALKVGANCRRNTFDSVWFEANDELDVEVTGHSNAFRNLYCGSASNSRNIQLYGNGNLFIGGSLRSVEFQSTPDGNSFYGCGVSSNGSLGFQGSATYARYGCYTVDTNQDWVADLSDLILVQADSASGYRIGGTPFAEKSAPYNVFYAPDGVSRGLLGTDADGRIFWNSTNHVFRSANGGADFATVNSTGINLAGLLQCDSFRIDQTPTAETPAATHTITISLNGTNYKLLCVAA